MKEKMHEYLMTKKDANKKDRDKKGKENFMAHLSLKNYSVPKNKRSIIND
jgi:hypothetical protein